MKDTGYLVAMIYCSEYEPTATYHFIRKSGKAKIEYLERWLSLDTETSYATIGDEKIGWVYQWAFKFGDDIVGGRTPSELIRALKAIRAAYDLTEDEKRRIVVFVHNLSFDIQYLKDWLCRTFGEYEILAIAPHRFITFRVGCFEFRCSWKLSNKSLAVWGHDLGCEHQKIVEKKSYYAETHYQDEPLTAENWDYQVRDVVALDECVEKQMDAYGDTIATIPLTSTGYVRRVARKNYKKDIKNRRHFESTALNEDTYTCNRAAFAGGLTHGNRFLCEKTISPDTEKGEHIRHRDFRSHYPTQQRTRGFPVGKFVYYGANVTLERAGELGKKHCLLMWLTLEDIRIKDGVVLPVLSVAKCYAGRKGKLKIVDDNGRILAAKGVTTIAVTDLDLKWILKQYKIKSYNIDKLWIATRGFLPQYMIETVDEFFKGKTAWKVLEKSAKTPEEKIYYHMELLKSKNGLNGIYGMTATDIIRELYEMSAETGEWTVTEPDIQSALSKYYKSKNSFNRYQWGVWTTAAARDELLTYAEIIQTNGGVVLYVDTDSIFYIGTDKTESAIEKENARRYDRAVKLGAYIEYERKRVTYDSFDDEGEDITEFRFLHAKCYAYKTNEDGLKCVIAGVNEFEDATHEYSREDELGDIDNLQTGKTFERCGGTMSSYTESPCKRELINGHMTEYASACIIENTTKTLHNQITIGEDYTEWEVL